MIHEDIYIFMYIYIYVLGNQLLPVTDNSTAISEHLKVHNKIYPLITEVQRFVMAY
jgi:hypothetical protein